MWFIVPLVLYAVVGSVMGMILSAMVLPAAHKYSEQRRFRRVRIDDVRNLVVDIRKWPEWLPYLLQVETLEPVTEGRPRYRLRYRNGFAVTVDVHDIREHYEVTLQFTEDTSQTYSQSYWHYRFLRLGKTDDVVCEVTEIGELKSLTQRVVSRFITGYGQFVREHLLRLSSAVSKLPEYTSGPAAKESKTSAKTAKASVVPSTAPAKKPATAAKTDAPEATKPIAAAKSEKAKKVEEAKPSESSAIAADVASANADASADAEASASASNEKVTEQAAAVEEEPSKDVPEMPAAQSTGEMSAKSDDDEYVMVSNQSSAADFQSSSASKETVAEAIAEKPVESPTVRRRRGRRLAD